MIMHNNILEAQQFLLQGQQEYQKNQQINDGTIVHE